jgi:DNA-binding Xre family transcriptional regulator
MPRKPFKQKADELIAWYKKNNGTGRLSDAISSIIVELSEFFGVSILSARIRLIDVGYSEAVGALEYVDGQYVPTHSFKAGVLGEKQTFTVPMKEGLIQYASNPAFAAVINKGDFVYIDGHYVINAPKFVEVNSFGILEMTDYALANMDECCLSFERSTRSNPEYSVQRYTECILYQNASSKTITEFTFKQTDNDKKVIETASAFRAELEEAKANDKLMADLPGSFGKSLVMIMKAKKITVEKLAELSQIDPKMIQRMRTDENQVWSIRKLVALCIGLKLPPDMSIPLIEKAGAGFKHGVKNGEEQITLRHILMTRYNSTIYECNDLLAEAGFPPLSSEE